MKIACFHNFLHENQFLPIYFTRKTSISQFSRAWSLYDVIVTSYINGWYLFWYHWKEDIHSYTMVVNLGLYDIPYWYSKLGCNNTSFGKYVQEKFSGELVLKPKHRRCIKLYIFNPSFPEHFPKHIFLRGGGCCNPPPVINIEFHITLNLLPVYSYGCPLSINTKISTIH